VGSGTGRAPGAEADGDGFPRRHTVIGADRLVSDEYGLRRELWHLALRSARDVALPPGVGQAVTELRALADDCRPPAPTTPPPGQPRPSAVPKPGAHMPHADALPRPRGGGVPRGPLGTLQGATLEGVLGVRTFDPATLETLRVGARRGTRRPR